MKNIITKIAILILAFTGITLDSYGQCTNTSLYPSAFTAPGTIGSPYTISGCQYRSEYNQMNGVVAGSNFTSTFATAGTYITIRYGAYNGTVVATGTTPLTWTATAGSGSYFIHYNVNSSCATDAPCVSSAITLNSGGGGGGGCTYLVPSSGNNSITASSGTICDHAGTSNYSNSVSGYTVINPVSGAAVLTFSSFALECCCDYVYVYNGAGIGGTLLWSGNCTTLPPVITSTSGPLTIQFTSDGSVTNTGFSATISNVPLSPPCASVTNISGPCVSTTTSVTGSGAYNPVSTSCGFSTPGQEKIFTFTPPATGTYTINQTTSIGYVDWFFKASSGGCSGTGWTCIDDVYNNFSSVGFTLTGGTQYYLMLDPETTTAGSLSFTVSPPVPSAPTPVTASPTTINCPGASVNLNATSAGNTIRWYTVPTGGTNIGTSASAANFGVTPAATTTYYAEAYNAACNLTSASRTAVTVTVHTLPGITCPSTQTLSLGGSCSASLPDYTSMATTTGSATPLTVTQSPVAGTTVTGNTTVTLTVTDACNNTATCNFAVNTIYTPSNLTLTADCSSPMSVSGTIGCIDNCNLRIGADKQVEVTIPAAGDWTFSLCGGGVWDSYIYLSASACGTSLYSDDDGCGGIGLSTLTYSIPSAGVYYIDVEGFAGASPGTPFTLTVTNATPAPSITCPAAQTLTLDGSCGGNLGDYTSMATTSGGNGTLTVTQSPASGTMVSGVGATTITLTATDACMRTATCSFSVNRVDNTAPATPSLSPVMGQCSAMAIAPTTTDACAGTITGTTVDPTSYTSQGTYMITWTFADGNGNSTSATQTVVVDDTNGPVPDMGSLSTVTANCGVTLTAPTATDACAGAITGTTGMTTYTSPGTYTVTWTYDDGNGNTTNQNQTVIVTAGSVTASSNTPICTGADVMLSAMGSSAGTYSWTGPNGFNSTTQNPSITGAQPNASGTYTVTWESSAYPGCTATNSTNVFVGPISLAVTPDPIDSTLAHAVISNCASPYTLFWRTLIAPTWSSMSSMANNPDITGLQPATAYVAYAVDANGATTGMVYFTTSGTSFCGLAPTLTALVNCDKIFVDWSGGVLYPQYSINSRKVSPTLTPLAGYYTAATSQVFTITPANFNATYEVSVAGMCDNQYSIRSAPSYVTVLDPRPGQPTGLTFTATCNSITTNWAAVAGAVGYFVKIKNPATGTITANIYTTNLTATKTGLSAGPVGTGYLYEVWVTPVGCSNLLGTPSQHYLVQTCTGNATPVGPRLQSPDPETLYASEMDNDTEAIMDIAMLVYPNPNHGAFTVSANLADASALVEVVNMLGQVVYTQKVALENGILNHEIKLSEGNTPGTYLVRVTSQSGNYVTKFVKM